MNFSDVSRVDDSLKWDAKYTCKLMLTTYFLELAKKGEKHYVRLRAQGPSPAMIKAHESFSKDDPKEKLEEKDRVFTARDKAVEFNGRHSGWAYEVSDWKAKNLRKPLKDLVEDILPILCLATYLEVRFCLEEAPQAFSDDAMVIGDDDRNHRGRITTWLE